MERKLSTGAGAPNRRRLEEASSKVLQAHHVEVGFLAWGPMTILVTISCRNNVAWVTALFPAQTWPRHSTQGIAPKRRRLVSGGGQSAPRYFCDDAGGAAEQGYHEPHREQPWVHALRGLDRVGSFHRRRSTAARTPEGRIRASVSVRAEGDCANSSSMEAPSMKRMTCQGSPAGKPTGVHLLANAHIYLPYDTLLY